MMSHLFFQAKNDVTLVLDGRDERWIVVGFTNSYFLSSFFLLSVAASSRRVSEA